MVERDYTHNHYVPEWYQRRFLPGGGGKFHYLDLNPETVRNGTHSYTRRALLRWGPPQCFAQEDLYSTFWGLQRNVDIERFFFGRIDSEGKSAVEFFGDLDIKPGLHESFGDLVRFMSVQKPRTPKGLRAFSEMVRIGDYNELLLKLQSYANVHCATWTDAAWQIADASKSSVKFLITDHPVTVYNRGCFPGARACAEFRDPDIRQVGTQTIFPICLEKILILTNLAWVRDPYQNSLKVHPNPRLFRTTMFKATDIQVDRYLSEQEVLEINFILKSRALRYVAAAEREWLFPEKRLSSTHWSKFGHGYLLMPEPRDINMGGTVYVGYKDGTSEAWSEYGHRPWEKEFENNKRFERESASLTRFQDEFAALFGPEWRGWSRNFGNEGPRRDSEEFYQHHLRGARRAGFKRKKPKVRALASE